MKVEKIREKDGKLELLVELSSAEAANEARRAALIEIGRHNLSCEQDGATSPVEFLRGQLGDLEASFLLDEDVMRRRAPFALTAALIDTIGTPVFRCSEHIEEGKPFKYQLVCVPVPEFELSDYGPVSITVPSSTVKDEEIEAELARMAQAASVNETDTSHDVVVKGDKVELALETTQDGEKIRPLCSASREYATGTLAMPDDFDDAIIGMSVGETKTFTFMGPEMELDGDGKPIMKEYETTATVKRILSSIAPAIDDNWAKTVKPGITTLAQLREEVAGKLSEEHEAEFQRTAQMFAGNELAKRLQGEISDLVYGVSVKEARENFERQLKGDNLTMDEYLKRNDMTLEQLNNALMMQVRTQLTRQFALNAYAKHYDLFANEDDLNLFFESIAPGKANLAHQDFDRDGRIYAARCAALRLKAARKAVEEADITRLGESRQER